MDKEEQERLVAVIAAIQMRLQAIARHHPNGQPKTLKEIDEELMQGLRLAVWEPTDQPH